MLFIFYSVSFVLAKWRKHIVKLYLDSLNSIIALNDIVLNNYVMNRVLRNRLDNIWCKYFCEPNFDEYFRQAPFGGYNDYTVLIIQYHPSHSIYCINMVDIWWK